MTFLKKGLFNFYDIIKRFIINDFETNRNKNTMCKNQLKRNISEKPKSFRSNFRFEHLYSSAAKCSNPDHPNWHHSVQTSGNLSFSSTLKMYKFSRKTYRLWQWTIWFHQTKRICTEAAAKHYICLLFKRSESWNISTVTTHCCITIFQGRKKQFTLNLVSDLGLHLKLVTF